MDMQPSKMIKRTPVSRAVQRLLIGTLAAAALPGLAYAQAGKVSTGSARGTSADVQADTDALPAVSVGASSLQDTTTAPYAGGQVARGGSIGILGTAKVIDQPFSTTNYTEEFIQDTQARTLGDVVINNASVRTEQSSGGFGDAFQIRGFDVSSSDVALNGLYGMVSAARMPVNLFERIEVLQGPGSLMYGMGPSGSIGGAINIVTKRADDVPLTRLTALYQSKGQFGAEVDVGRRFGDQGQWGIRVNGMYKDGQTGIAHGNQSQGDGSIALDYRGQKLRWSFDAYNSSDNTDEFRSQIGFGAATALPSAPSAYSNLYPGTKLKLRDTAAMTRLEYDFNEYVTVYGAAGEHYGTSKQNFPYTSGVDNAGNFDVYNGYYDAYNRTRSADVGARFHFDTFGVKHTLVAGVTSLNQEQGYFYALSDTTAASSIYNPSPLPAVSVARGDAQRNSHLRLFSEQLVDTLSFWNGRLLVTGGFRHQTIGSDNYDPTSGDRTSSYSKSAISPLAGIVFKPVSNVSVYGNFTSGLTDGGSAPSYAANPNQAFAPYKSNQYEAGVKADWGRVMTTVSVFQIAQPNYVTNAVTNIYGQEGQKRVRGLELAAYGNVIDRVRVMASATFYDAKLRDVSDGSAYGDHATNVPSYAFNLGAEYDLPWATGLSLNGRIIHNGSQYYDGAAEFRIPSWTRYDIGARYRTRIFDKNVVFRANVENLFGSRYWLQQGTYLTTAAPRTVFLSAQFDF
ncbi:TonB-dependent receptor [Chitinasiproducens palmae]|uniref:Iron complex outermembrane recepter protein n=1 Tax=Chitinasiproducens palmae TaxID=1770053 RepID=A0A1H2PU08_9BURK|nr:TonB-dependent receptor [Chitinasiproducens palmae]SDV50629.1 iron complex outermembrane recepter protein [Chitinasiproducens palmae]